jgi:DNA-binding CsgD family transcriptional regulator
MTMLPARTHMRRVFAKTDTRRQGELIGLVLRTAPYDLRRV